MSLQQQEQKSHKQMNGCCAGWFVGLYLLFIYSSRTTHPPKQVVCLHSILFRDHNGQKFGIVQRREIRVMGQRMPMRLRRGETPSTSNDGNTR
jgi:hypothetical protein